MIQTKAATCAAAVLTASACWAGDGPGGVVFPSGPLNKLPWHLGVESLGLMAAPATIMAM